MKENRFASVTPLSKREVVSSITFPVMELGCGNFFSSVDFVGMRKIQYRGFSEVFQRAERNSIFRDELNDRHIEVSPYFRLDLVFACFD